MNTLDALEAVHNATANRADICGVVGNHRDSRCCLSSFDLTGPIKKKAWLAPDVAPESWRDDNPARSEVTGLVSDAAIMRQMGETFDGQHPKPFNAN
jgi:hypothetical protein